MADDAPLPPRMVTTNVPVGLSSLRKGVAVMGGWMSYQRMRTRNLLMFRKPDDDPDPYFRGGDPRSVNWHALVGDLNRMERDYLSPVYPSGHLAARPERSDPAAEVADATGVDVETVRAVLRYVFMEQR